MTSCCSFIFRNNIKLKRGGGEAIRSKVANALWQNPELSYGIAHNSKRQILLLLIAEESFVSSMFIICLLMESSWKQPRPTAMYLETTAFQLT